jgi:hypothetical protein
VTGTLLRSKTLFRCIVLAAVTIAGFQTFFAPVGATANHRASIRDVAPPEYPIPPTSDTLLFFLQRSNNSNTVVYEANLEKDGSLDFDRPVNVYWIRYNTTGKRRKLNTAERVFAYGVVTERMGDNDYLVHLVSHEDRKARVNLDGNGKPRAIMKISGQRAILRAAFVKVKGGGSTPTVVHVDVFGVNLETGQPLHERFKP